MIYFYNSCDSHKCISDDSLCRKFRICQKTWAPCDISISRLYPASPRGIHVSDPLRPENLPTTDKGYFLFYPVVSGTQDQRDLSTYWLIKGIQESLRNKYRYAPVEYHNWRPKPFQIGLVLTNDGGRSAYGLIHLLLHPDYVAIKQQYAEDQRGEGEE